MLASGIEIAYFPEASSTIAKGPYDLSLVEGSITTAHDAERIRKIRAASRSLVTLGACATAGGAAALRLASTEHITLHTALLGSEYLAAFPGACSVTRCTARRPDSGRAPRTPYGTRSAQRNPAHLHAFAAR